MRRLVRILVMVLLPLAAWAIDEDAPLREALPQRALGGVL